MQSNYCIDATMRHAVQEGFNVTLVSDAHSTFPFTDEPASAIIKALGFTDVIDAGACVDLAATGAPTQPQQELTPRRATTGVHLAK